jgi:hypothetical protein
VSVSRAEVLLVAPSGSKWNVMDRSRNSLACFGTEEEAVAYAGFLARSRPVELLQILDADGTIAYQDWLTPTRRPRHPGEG